MTRDGAVALEGQAQFAKPRGAPPLRFLGQIARREEALDEQLAGGIALQINADRARHKLAPPAQHGHRMLLGRALGQQRLLRISTRMPERDGLPRVEFDAFFRKSGGGEMGQGQVHVVAADQRMISDRDSAEGKLAPFVGDADEREIGRASADVADQQRIADAQAFAPGVAHVGQPRIERGLRLFQQDQFVRQPRQQRRLARQLARAGIERRRHRQHNVLLRDGGIGKGARPDGHQVLEIAPRGFDRRHLRHLRRRVPRKNRLMTIDPAVREPRLGGGHRARWHIRRLSHGHRTDGVILPSFPGKIERTASRLLLGPQVQERRKHALRLNRPGSNKLRHQKQFYGRGLFAKACKCKDAVGRPEINPNRKLRCLIIYRPWFVPQRRRDYTRGWREEL